MTEIEPGGSPEVTASEPEDREPLDPQMVQMAVDRLRGEQNLAGGLLAGAVAALAGAAAWAAVTVTTNYQIGFMALGVGFLVGLAVRLAGKGIDRSFAVAGALLALAGCLLGNLLTVSQLIASEEGMELLAVLGQLSPAITLDLMVATFQPMDLLFYGLAVYEGYKLSPRHLSREELLAAMPGSTGGHELA